MSNPTAKIVLALVLLTAPAASFAQMTGEAGAGNLPVNGILPGLAKFGGINNVRADPSGIRNASRLPPLSQPNLSVPQIPQFK